jgi:hypothetical protein
LSIWAVACIALSNMRRTVSARSRSLSPISGASLIICETGPLVK